MSELIFKPATTTDIPQIFALCKELIDRFEDVENID